MCCAVERAGRESGNQTTIPFCTQPTYEEIILQFLTYQLRATVAMLISFIGTAALLDRSSFNRTTLDEDKMKMIMLVRKIYSVNVQT